MDHHEIFTASNFDWPVDWSSGSNEEDVPPDGMYPRERESLLFLHRRFAFCLENEAEFVEINSSLPRLLQGCVEQDSEYKKFKRSPWRTTPGTLIGSGKVAVRYAAPAGSKPAVVVRLLEPIEYLRCIGWDESFCESQFFNLRTLPSVDITPPFTLASYSDLIGNMAGNAWSAYSYAAVRTALIATSGRYSPTEPPVEVDDEEVDMDMGAPAPSADPAAEESSESERGDTEDDSSSD